MKDDTASPPPPPILHQEKRVEIRRSISWFAADPSKAYYEKFSLIWAPMSMFVLLVGVFATPLYKYCDRNSYLAITVVGCLPGVLIPLLFPCKADKGRPLSQRFWVKATLWIAIFGFYGNYFWTHYFYELLGAQYLFDSYRFNDVPLVTYTATFFYFTFYFNFVNLFLRRVARLTADLPTFSRRLLWWTNICAWAYGTAMFEALSIQHFPLYTYTNRESFMVIGSVVYGLYFVVGFPMFFGLDENYSRAVGGTGSRVSLQTAAISSFAATSIVSLLLDLWRLGLGSIYELGAEEIVPIPFIYQKKACAEPAPTPVKTLDINGCVNLASKCAHVATSWAYRKVSKVSDIFQAKTYESTAPLSMASR